MPKIDAAILAGGKSSRMGTNKALLDIGGRRMIEQVAEIVQQVCEHYFVVANTPERYDFLNIPCYEDIIKNVGPLGGIHSALTHANSRHCLVIACDLPFISVGLLKYLCENAAGHHIFAIESSRGIEPLCAVYSKKSLQTIEAQILQKEFAVIDLYKRLTAKIVHTKELDGILDDAFFLNVNTPEDLQLAKLHRQKANS
jgi:molybdopterin-guanine dinucleotide biosynthesis protein A